MREGTPHVVDPKGAAADGASRAGAPDEPPMETAAIALVREVFDAFSRRDLHALVERTDPEIELFAPTAMLANEGRCYRGHEGIGRYLQDVERVWARLEVIPEKFREVGNHVVATGRVRAEARDGLEVDNPAAWVWELRAGRLCWGCVYDDPGTSSMGVARGSDTTAPVESIVGDLPRPVPAT
jgi:ketosteroid isomerase-like protein